MLCPTLMARAADSSNVDPSGRAARPGAPAARARRNVHLSVEERVARGKAARQAAPRADHGTWQPAADRPDPIALLEEQSESRVPELVPIRYGRMLVSPFTFYRGAALVMAADLASTPQSGINVQLCGDAHLSNFGLFGSPERQVLFDINDFDETLPGPWEWDVKRLAASIEVLGRERGFSPDDRRAILRAAVREYRLVMRHAANLGTLEAWYDHMDVEQVMSWVRAEVAANRLGKKEARQAEKDVAKARTRDSMRVFAKRTDEIDGKIRIVADPPLIVPLDDLILREGLERRLGAADAFADPEVPAIAGRPPPSDRGVRVRPHCAQGRRRRQCRDPRLDPPLRRTRRATTRCSSSRKKPKPRCSSGSSARASMPTTAGGWSWANG